MAIGIVSHPDCELHLDQVDHAESPQRVQIIQEALQQYPFQQPLKFFTAPEATREQLERVHPPHYINWLTAVAPKSGMIGIDEDTLMTPSSLRAAFLAAGSVTLAVDQVMTGELQAAFCNVRPPGHHAEREKAMGFCFFNNVAVGIRHAMAVHGVQRVAIIDFDVHHGNGTQEIFQEDERVMLCSSFEHPLYPGYEPEMDNAHIISVPLAAGSRGDVYRQKTAAAWFSRLQDFKPDLIFFSAGFDAHENDPLANIALTAPDYAWLTNEIRAIAETYSQGRMISVLEGGYDLEALAQSVPAHVNALELQGRKGRV